MTDDLVKRLRAEADCGLPSCAVVREAADHIEMLRCGRDKWEINASQLEEVCVQRYDRIKALEEHAELVSRTSRTRYDELMVLKHRVSVLEMALREIQSITSAPDVYSLSHDIARRALESK